MLFSTIDFIIFFVLVLAVLVLVKNRKFQHLFVLLASYFFLYYSNNYFIILILISTILDFYVAQAIAKSNNQNYRKLLLTASIVGNLGLLGFFKYTDFAITQFNVFGSYFDLQQQIPVLNIFLPIGISFYTFQTIGYTIDVFRGHIKPRKSFLDFALFVAFFPQLVAGPILRAKTFFSQMDEKFGNPSKQLRLKQFVFQNTNLKFGISLMAIGFFKKMFFADNIAPLVNDVFLSPVGSESLTIILATIGFAIQVYGDFSGYSDIAIGAAMILGIKIPPNFNKPFFAKTPAEFWKRWHISLSSWVRDYLYFPLIWGNKRSHIRILLGILISMTLLGVWHGASWNFFIFGFFWGIVIAGHQLILSLPKARNIKFFKTRAGQIFSILVTQYFVLLGFLIFRVKDLDELIYSMQKFVILDFKIENTFELIKSHEIAVGLMLIFVILHFISYKIENLPERISNLKHRYWFLFILVITLLILLLYGGTAKQFVYFQF